jgi:hypothetical protein
MDLCHANYSIFYFPLPEDDQDQVPKLLLRSLKLDEFKTRAKRLGRVVRLAKATIQYWECGSNILHVVPWNPKARRERG